MGTMDQERREEQARADQVVSEIGKQIATLEEQVGRIRAEVVEFRKNFWDDVTVNLEEPDDVIETAASIRQQAEVLSERERSHRHSQQRLKTLIRLRESPYFGRIDFREDGSRAAEPIYIGIASLLDEGGEQFLIYDWRAPIASLYYDYPPGTAQYETPEGIIKGEIELKRQFIIRRGRIESMFDTGVTIGDELLKEVLGKQGEAQLKSIVATIQQEQNRLIRNERSRLLIVKGAAGSGKTSAALQRVAYLLYRHRESLVADQIVLFSPNPLFNSYVSTVLPELGEENMQQTTFQEYLERRLGSAFQLEDPYAQLEYVLTAMEETGYDARIEGIRYKASADFLHVIDRYIEYLGRQGMRFKDIRFRGQPIIRSKDIMRRFYDHDPSEKIPNRLEQTVAWLIEELKRKASRERQKPWVDEEIERLDKEAYQWVTQELRRKQRLGGRTFDDYTLERNLLATKVVNQRFRPLVASIKRFGFADLPAVYRQLFADPGFVLRFAPEARLPEQWPAICAQTVERLERGELSYEDAVPYLYLKERIEGFRTHPSIRHVFVDEAQDYSFFQFAILRRMFPFSKMTVLGDPNQGIFAHTSGHDLAPLESLFPPEQTETVVLLKSYRSTRQIVEFTRQLIQGDEIEPFNRNGKKPTLTQVNSPAELAVAVAQRIRQLLSANHRTVAVVCKTAKESREAYEALRNLVPLRLITSETTSFEPGALVIPAYLAKGVEFDAVILYNASRQQNGRESERKLFYTACTRAMHELHLYSAGEPSPFLSGVSAESYVREPAPSPAAPMP